MVERKNLVTTGSRTPAVHPVAIPTELSRLQDNIKGILKTWYRKEKVDWIHLTEGRV
jgi:hypothetical protein